MSLINLSEKQKKIVGLVLGGIIFIVLGWKLGVEPVKGKLLSSRQAAFTARERSQVIADIHQLQKELAKLEGTIESEKNRHLILGEVTKLANANSVALQSMVPTTASEGNYTKLSLSVKASGTFKSLLDFLLAVEESKSNITVASISLSSQQTYGYDESGAVTQVPVTDLLLVTYLKKG